MFVEVLVVLVYELDFDCVVVGMVEEVLVLVSELCLNGILFDIGLLDVLGLSVLECLKCNLDICYILVYVVLVMDCS